MAEKTMKTPAKSVPKLFDVAKPGKQKPSATSKPVIVSNRPIMQDPMMLSAEMVAESVNKPNRVQPKVVIKPLTEAEKKEDAGKPQQAKGTKESDADEIPVIRLEPASESQTLPTHGGFDSNAAEKPEAAAVTDSAEPGAASGMDSEAEPAGTADQEVDSPVPAEEKRQPATPDLAGSTGTSDTDLSSGVDPAKENKETAALEAAAKQQAALDELVETKQYFLPINSVGKRRSKITALFGLLLIVVLGLLLANLMMDAGFIQVNGVEPLTHFFSS